MASDESVVSAAAAMYQEHVPSYKHLDEPLDEGRFVLEHIQGRDDSIKQFSIQPHPTYLPTSKICRAKLCTELFYAIISTLFLCFLLICYPYISLCF